MAIEVVTELSRGYCQEIRPHVALCRGRCEVMPRASLTCLWALRPQADGPPCGGVSGVSTVVLCTSESGNAQLGSNHNEIEMKKITWAVWGPLWLGAWARWIRWPWLCHWVAFVYFIILFDYH